MYYRDNYLFSSKLVRIRIKGQSKVLPVTGFAEVDRPYFILEKTTDGKLDFIAVRPQKDNDQIYKIATEIERPGFSKYRIQTVTARKDGESVTMALTSFCDVDHEYLIVAGEESDFLITDFKNSDYIEKLECAWNEFDEIMAQK